MELKSFVNEINWIREIYIFFFVWDKNVSINFIRLNYLKMINDLSGLNIKG